MLATSLVKTNSAILTSKGNLYRSHGDVGVMERMIEAELTIVILYPETKE